MDVMFIRVFDNEVEADNFAMLHHTKAIIQYDWDDLSGKIVQQFVVKY